METFRAQIFTKMLSTKKGITDEILETYDFVQARDFLHLKIWTPYLQKITKRVSDWG